MLKYIGKRLLLFIPTIFIISVVIFFIIQLPPGDYATSYAAAMAAELLDIPALAAGNAHVAVDIGPHQAVGEVVDTGIDGVDSHHPAAPRRLRHLLRRRHGRGGRDHDPRADPGAADAAVFT